MDEKPRTRTLTPLLVFIFSWPCLVIVGGGWALYRKLEIAQSPLGWVTLVVGMIAVAAFYAVMAALRIF